MKTYIKKGAGYWDITFYPYGGCFGRAKEEIEVIPTGKPGQLHFEKIVKTIGDKEKTLVVRENLLETK